MTIVHIVRVYFFLGLLVSLATSEYCYQEGECLNSPLIDLTHVATREACHDLCLQNPDCNYFTFYENFGFEDGECVLLSDCANFSNTTCTNCFSGQRDCDEYRCYFNGLCLGNFVGSSHAEDVNDCKNQCQMEPACIWFTFNEDGYLCSRTGSCSNTDDTCVSCVSGQSECADLQEPTKLYFTMNIDGREGQSEVVDLSSIDTNCNDPIDFPVNVDGAVGFTHYYLPVICGGRNSRDCYMNDPIKDNWTQIVSMAETRYHAAAVNIAYNEFWIMGGMDENLSPKRTTEIFKDGTFIHGATLPEPMERHCVVKLNTTHIFVAGGRSEYPNGTEFLSSHANIVNLGTFEWTSLPGLESPRASPACGYFLDDDDTILVVAGGSQDNQTLGTVETYNLGNPSPQWIPGPPLPDAIELARTVQFHDHFLMTGGFDGSQDLDSIFSFGKDRNWHILIQSLRYPRNSHVVFPFPNKWVNCQ